MVNINPNRYPVLASRPLEQWHKEMWEWLAQYPQFTKEDFVNTVFTDDEVDLLYGSWYCFACLFAGRRRKVKNNSCEYCPLCAYGQYGLNCLHGLFDKWCKAKDFKNFDEAKKIATQIANLTWRVK